ncbi:hypothetical protein [Streptomyces sp. SM13]|uniref:hypothetical protein n=1 Tax=Streptomyces sp. SM13 TaxID=1983803 RepID=UPI000CD51862|nr:hypothetical protein [Streptomyces sp. SM13]
MLSGDEDAVVGDDRAEGLGALGDGQELLDVAPVRSRDRDGEKAVVGAEGGTVGCEHLFETALER